MSKRTRLSRRGFLGATLAAGAGASLFTIAGTKSSGKVLGANEKVRIAIAGLNGRGGAHVGAFSKIDGVEIAYVVDPDTRTYAERVREIESAGGGTPKTVQDVRRVLDDPNIDAVTIATPNHWHSLMAIWACQAGKDVYVEKPVSHNIFEGRMAVAAARKHNRIVQHGTQGRSSKTWMGTMDFIRSGQAGKLLISRGLCYKPRGTIGVKAPEAPPSELDFNLWLGPAPQQAYHGNLVHYNWHWFWDTGNGDIGNQGVHQMDIARWGIPGAKLPKSALSLGGRFGYEDQGETPNTQIALFDYGDTQLIFEVRGLKTDEYQGEKIGNLFHCEGGTVALGRFYPNGSDKHVSISPAESEQEGNHFANFIGAVRSRRQEDLFAEVEEGHYSSALCHLANASYRLGDQVAFEPRTKALGDNEAAYDALSRAEDHLARTNNLPVVGLQYRLGKLLTVDPERETVDDADGAALLTRQYREPFVVPNLLA